MFNAMFKTKWKVESTESEMSTDPATFRCSAACNLFTFFFFAKKALGLSPWHCTIRSQHVIIMIHTRAAWGSFFKSLVGYFRERLFPVRAIRANGSLELACRERESNPGPTGWSKLIGAPLPQPRPSRRRAGRRKRIHQPHPIASFIAVHCESSWASIISSCLLAWKFLFNK